ncbi:hypothetical protein [Cognatishimia sp. F0-27]|uniref:hypothetical protein n=1 Tax=Cognatishimia sp. F0-27 TaxID=2816855 RepID=UPI001D0CC6EE|nr:hypothetical protein [Cognatishimia sp. F0-27]MCC1494203.1 hypothetical protein [Cognatishimia sp. F0-27]
MRTFILTLCVTAALPALAQAACFVEYKAKQDSPLRLHYGILQIDGACPGGGQTRAITADRLQRGGWTLLNIVGRSETVPEDNKKANAGAYYLRY